LMMNVYIGAGIMKSLRIGNIRRNKLMFIIAILLFSLMSIFMPNSIVETYGHHDYENSVKHVINDTKPTTNLRKFLLKIRSSIHKIFRMPQILSNIVVLVTIRSALFNRRFSKVAILHLFYFLCFYFHGSNYKQGRIHSDLFPLMAV